MANDLTANPFIIDTAAATVLTTRRLRVQLRWVGGTTAGHTCVVKDKNGRVMWESFANAANFIDESVLVGDAALVDGLIVSALGSGKLYIYYE